MKNTKMNLETFSTNMFEKDVKFANTKAGSIAKNRFETFEPTLDPLVPSEDEIQKRLILLYEFYNKDLFQFKN